MMFVMKTKFVFPELPPGVLFSDRLKSLDIAGPQAVMLTAPAGYGKTTAVQLALQECRETTHWYKLEKEDDSLLVFFSNLIESLFGSAARDTDSERSLSSIGNIIEEFSLLAAVVCQDTWSTYGQESRISYLVFDDFHCVADNAAIREIIRYFISNMPPNIHIVVISRKDAGIIEGKLALSGSLVCLDETCLFFSMEEIEALFSGSGMEATARKIFAGEVLKYTEGWIAGVTLMKYMLDRREAGYERSLVSDRYSVFRYLLGEVFTGADREMMLQAARISLLEEFICDDLSGVFQIENPEETVLWLERNNLYIQKTNTDPASYRFHSLFRDALQHLLASEYTPVEIDAFHLAAAGYFEKTERYAAAVEHYLLGSDKQSAVRLASKMGFAYMDSGDMESAAELIRAMPEQMIFGNATLMIILGCSLCSAETERGFAYIEKAMEMAVKNKEFAAAIKVQGFAISVLIQQNNFAGIKGVIDKVPMHRAIMANRQVWKMLIHSLFLKTATSYQVKPAKALSRIIDKINMKDSVDLWQYSTLLSKAYLYNIIGDFSEAGDVIRQLAEHPIALRNDRWLVFGLQLCCILSNLMGNTDDLIKYADKMSSLGMKYADAGASSSGANNTALAKYQSRDIAGAVLTAGIAEKLYIENKNLSMAILAGVMQDAWQAELDTDGRYAAKIEERLAPLAAAGGIEGLWVLAKTLSGALYLREGDIGKAEELLTQTWKWAKSKQAFQSMCGIAMHLSKLYREKGDDQREAKYLKFFGETAVKKGYVYFREMSFASLVRVCARCVQENIASRHMAVVIGKYFGYDAAGYLLKEPSTIAADPDGFVMRFPVDAGSGPDNVWVKLFGAFCLIVDGKKIDLKIFKTRKISNILKCILANPGKTVSREKLAAAFWPDSEGKAALNSLRVALFELRKALAALDMPLDSGRALIAEGLGGFYVCRPEIVESDVSRFTAIYERLQTERLSREDETAALKELSDLYEGDYIEGVDSDEFAIDRAHYHAIYAEVSYKLVERYLSEGKTGPAEELMLKHMKADPFDERLCGTLIDLYRKTGRAKQAEALKRRFTQYYEKAMGVKPDI